MSWRNYTFLVGSEDEFRIWFQSQVNKTDDCWEWTGRLNPSGYGLWVPVPRMFFLTHRISYELDVCDIPKGLFVCHHCDNRKCLKIEHLFLGTCADNVHDMMRKGRQRFGITDPHKKASVDLLDNPYAFTVGDDVVVIKGKLRDGVGHVLAIKGIRGVPMVLVDIGGSEYEFPETSLLPYNSSN